MRLITVRKGFDSLAPNMEKEQTTEKEIPDFDLPAPREGAAVAKPRVHISDNACISCEG